MNFDERLELLQELASWGFLFGPDAPARGIALGGGIFAPKTADRAFELEVIQRRHRSLRVGRRPAPENSLDWRQLFVKRASSAVAGGFAGLGRERRFFAAAEGEPLRSRLGRWLILPLDFPRPKPVDGEASTIDVMVFPWLVGSEPFWQLGSAARSRSAGSRSAGSRSAGSRSAGAREAISEARRAASDLGQALAALHSAFRPPSPADPELVEALGSARPVALELDGPEVEVLGQASPAHLRLLRLIQTERGLVRASAEARRGWVEWCRRDGTLIHAELTSENLLRLGPEVRPIDWEHARWGDPSFDIATVLAGAALARIDAHLATQTRADDGAGALAAAMARELWQEYGRARAAAEGWKPDSEFRRRLPLLAALRLTQDAWERAHGLDRLSRRMLLAMQLAVNLVERPRPTAAAAFGFDPMEDGVGHHG